MDLTSNSVRFGVLIVSLMVVFGNGCSNSHQGETPSNTFVAPPMILSFENRDGWLLKHEFKVANASAQNMRLRVQGTTCGCTACKIDKTLLKKGELAKIEMLVAVPYERSHRTESVFIETDTPEKVLSFTLTGDVFPAISIRPFQRKLFFSQLGSRQFDVVVYSEKGRDFDELIVENTCESIRIHIGSAQISDLKSIIRRTYPISFDILSKFKEETLVKFKFGINSLPVAVFFHSEPNVRTLPFEVLFPRLNPYESRPEKILVELAGKNPFTIQEISYDRELIEVSEETEGTIPKHQISLCRANHPAKKVASMKTVVHISSKTLNGELETIDLPVYFMQ
jgi:hypothetical protein